ncbi:hypothetical protein B0H67DRAFT_481338 [Lasiosphaeris hirsuta]|uniref:Uncharacterized protein n=1 Tax=Lasiosphaeris hirsuta TaxID=260670 RepID=A0AA40E2C8_9PEZI|nr:hypothetical protein B0H67DRAFT_481338 [Lasiosphaeris hirsuta]
MESLEGSQYGNANLQPDGSASAPELASSQEVPMRDTNPLKLMALLRKQFGLGRYQISMVQSVYNIRTPRRLSLDEIAQCRGF